MSWNPSSLKLKNVSINGGAAIVTQGDTSATISVSGAGFSKGLTLVFILDAAEPAAVIPVNEVVFDPADAHATLRAKISPVLKNCGAYRLVAWLPPLDPSTQAGVAPGVNDVATLERALVVQHATTLAYKADT